MKMRLGETGYVCLDTIPYGSFARDPNGRIYFAPLCVWLTMDDTGGFCRVNSSEILVQRLPLGTEIILTSER